MTKGLGRNTKTGGNPSNELYILQVLNKILNGTLATPSNLAKESTLISVLNAIVSSDQDIEILLVRDTGTSDVVVQQITNYETGVPVVTYQGVDGTPYVPVGPLEYLDPSAVLNLVLNELLEQGISLDSIKTKTDLLAPVTKTPNLIRTTSSGTVPGTPYSVSIANAGSAEAVVMGVALKANEILNFDAGGRDTLASGSITYDATGTELIIIYIS